MPDWLWLAFQSILAIIAIEQLRRHTIPVVNDLQHPSLVLDVWGPLTLIIPMLFFFARIDNAGATTHGLGWMMIGGPIACGLIALGLSMMVERPPQAGATQGLAVSRKLAVESEPSAAPGPAELIVTRPLAPRLILSTAGAGFLLLLLGAAHDLTLWIGQCAFAIAAVLLWMNTPDLLPPHHHASLSNSSSVPPTAHFRAGVSMTIALICGLGQGLMSLPIAPQSARISGVIIVVTASMILAYAARLAGPVAALRLGLWTATLGVLLGLGSISLAHVIPEAWNVIRTGESRPLNRIATGFGNYVFEAMILMAIGGAYISQQRLGLSSRRIVGWALVLFAASLAAWRLAMVATA